MNLTNKYLNTLYTQYEDSKGEFEMTLAFKRIYPTLRRLEDQLIQRPLHNCIVSNINDKTLDFTKVSSVITKEYYNGELLNDVSCVFRNHLYYWLPGLDDDERLHTLIEKLTVIGEPSKNGEAYITRILGQDNLFVVKTMKDQNDVFDQYKWYNIIRELAIGYHLNSLRKKIPNFMITIGHFFSKNPSLKEDITGKDVVDKWGWHDLKRSYIPYIVLENINPSIPSWGLWAQQPDDMIMLFGSYTKRDKVQDFLTSFCQLILSLKIAYDMCDFTHNDLHQDNVLIRKGIQNSYIEYEIDSRKYYVKGDFVSTIIDFGYAHAKFEGNPIGPCRLVKYFVHAEKSHPMSDVYRYYMSAYATFFNTDPIIKEKMSRIFRLFNTTDTITDAISYQQSLGFNIPITKLSQEFNHIDFIYRLQKLFPEYTLFTNTRPNAIIASCNNNKCSSIHQMMKDHTPYQDIPSIYNSITTGNLQNIQTDNINNILTQRDKWINDVNLLLRTPIPSTKDVQDELDKINYLFTRYELVVGILEQINEQYVTTIRSKYRKLIERYDLIKQKRQISIIF